MKVVVIVLLILFAALQYKLWSADGGMREVWRLKAEVAAQRKENGELQDRNRALTAEIQDLKKGTTALEERARNDLGMIGTNETFFQIVPPGADADVDSHVRPQQPTAQAR
jgi:cell division protein FtsB